MWLPHRIRQQRECLRPRRGRTTSRGCVGRSGGKRPNDLAANLLDEAMGVPVSSAKPERCDSLRHCAHLPRALLVAVLVSEVEFVCWDAGGSFRQRLLRLGRVDVGWQQRSIR